MRTHDETIERDVNFKSICDGCETHTLRWISCQVLRNRALIRAEIRNRTFSLHHIYARFEQLNRIIGKWCLQIINYILSRCETKPVEVSSLNCAGYWTTNSYRVTAANSMPWMQQMKFNVDFLCASHWFSICVHRNDAATVNTVCAYGTLHANRCTQFIIKTNSYFQSTVHW